MYSVQARKWTCCPQYYTHPFSSSAVSLSHSPYMQSDLLSIFL